MTTCPTFADAIKKRVEEGKNLEDIAKELCGGVKFDREKIIRVIKDLIGEQYLIDHAKTLGYNAEMAQLAKKKKSHKNSHKKIDATTDEDNVCKPAKEKEPTPNITDALQDLIKEFGEEAVINALKSILQGAEF